MVKRVHIGCLALFVVICALSLADGASVGRDQHAIDIGKPEESRIKRQTDESSEDSDEDDEGADEDAQQYQIAAQQAQVSQESSDEDNDDGREDDDAVGNFFIRRRRDVEKPAPAPAAAEAAAQTDKSKPNIVEEKPETELPAEPEVKPVVVSNAEDIASSAYSVLVLIRDRFKKVTGGLPTDQVANQALQYFQLFEHFIQQSIEDYIGDDKDEDEAGATTISPPLEGEAGSAPPSGSAETDGIKAPEQSAVEQQNEANVMATVAAKPPAETVAEKPATVDAETRPEVNVV